MSTVAYVSSKGASRGGNRSREDEGYDTKAAIFEAAARHLFRGMPRQTSITVCTFFFFGFFRRVSSSNVNLDRI